MIRFFVIFVGLFVVLAMTPAPAQTKKPVLTIVPAASEAKRSITKIAGDLYRFQNNFHYSVFLVTSNGVIATDPINKDAAEWLKAEIKERFDQPIRYVIYSHDHADHIAGGDVFADTATFIAHENAAANIVGEKRPTAIPDITFKRRLELTLGGKTVQLRYMGTNHSNGSIVMLFPEEKTLFAVDIVTVKRLPFMGLSDAYFPQWQKSLKRIEQLDFDILAPGHGVLGTKQDMADHRGYIEDLYDGVLAGLRAGKSVDEIKQSLLLEDYKDWGQYEAWRELNIEGMARNISLHRRGN